MKTTSFRNIHCWGFLPRFLSSRKKAFLAMKLVAQNFFSVIKGSKALILLCELEDMQQGHDPHATTTLTNTSTFSTEQILALSQSATRAASPSYYLETSNEGGELVTHVRVKK